MITLNLLPPIQRTEIKREAIYLAIENSLTVLLLVLIALALILFFAKKILENNFKELATQGIQTTIETSGLNRKIQDINGTLKIIEGIQKKSRNILPFVLEFGLPTQTGQFVPEKIKINSLQINLEENTINIKGWASTRSDLLRFKENLESSDKFTGVKIPLTNLLERRDVEFDIAAQLNH